MPYRIDLSDPSDHALESLVELGALDVALVDGALAAVVPDDVPPSRLAATLGLRTVATSPAIARDAGSVWLVERRPMSVGRISIHPAPAGRAALAMAPTLPVLLTEGAAFGTGFHPTTMLCLELLDELVGSTPLATVLDVGTGSGVLALAALRLGVPRAIGLDIDPGAVAVAAANAEVNGLSHRLQLVAGGPDAVGTSSGLVVANILAAPLIEMAPALARTVAGRGVLLLSGIPAGVEADVRHAYRRVGMRDVEARTRAGWVALLCRASW